LLRLGRRGFYPRAPGSASRARQYSVLGTGEFGDAVGGRFVARWAAAIRGRHGGNRMARMVWMAGLLALGIGGTVAAGAAWAQTDPVAQRRDEMKRLGAHLEAIKKTLDAGEPVAPIAARAEEMRGYFATLPTLFPPGSTEGSKALPAVWTDRAGFEQAAATATQAAAKLAAAAGTNDTAATAAAFREVGGSCGGCHRNFRGR
jgi:cytochrome c556